MSENNEDTVVTAIINEFWDKHKFKDVIVSEVYHPDRFKKTTDKTENGEPYKTRPSLDWITHTPHIFMDMAKRNGELALIFYNIQTQSYSFLNQLPSLLFPILSTPLPFDL